MEKTAQSSQLIGKTLLLSATSYQLRANKPTEAQFDALDTLTGNHFFGSYEHNHRFVGENIFISFTVPARVLLATTFKHRFLIHPDGTIDPLPMKTIESKTKTSSGLSDLMTQRPDDPMTQRPIMEVTP